jgi:pimeloyl-ACP methyl ester carboxylesterase
LKRTFKGGPEVPFVEVQNARLYYDVQGTGAPLILLHSAWASHKWWQWQVPDLSKDYKIYALDLKGHGQSSPLQHVNSIEGFCGDLENFLQKMDVEISVLIGWSMGGMIALQYCMDHPLTVAALVLIATQGHRNPELKRRLIVQYFLERLSLMMDFTAPRKYDRTAQQFPGRGPRWLAHQIRESLSSSAPKEVLDWLVADITAEPRENFFNVMRSAWNWQAGKRLTQMKVPILILVGKDDHLTPPPFSQRLHASLPNSKLVIIENAGHFLPMEHPKRVNTEILNFLKSINY